MLNLSVYHFGVQTHFTDHVTTHHQGTVFHFQLFGVGHFVAQLEGFNGGLLQHFKLLSRKVVFDSVERFRIAAVFQQFFDDQAGLFTLFV
ncbi:hypothetical protein D3C78_1099020 [compost metagenome]